LFAGLPLAALAVDAAGAGEDRGGEGRCDGRLPGARKVHGPDVRSSPPFSCWPTCS